jgi:hypothetical protein
MMNASSSKPHVNGHSEQVVAKHHLTRYFFRQTDEQHAFTRASFGAGAAELGL